MKMNRIFIVAMLALMVTGCVDNDAKPVSKDADDTLKRVPGLQDCKAYKGIIDGRLVTIIRCPNSTVTAAFSSGKSTDQTITIEDYARAASDLEESKKKVVERTKELAAAQKEFDEAVEKLKR